LGVEQRVLDGADGLLRHAAGGLAPQRVHQRHLRLERARVLPQERGRELLDHAGHAAGTAEVLVVLAPAHDARIRGELDEVEVSPAPVGVQRLDLGDLHAAGAPPGMSRYRGSRCPGSGLTVAPSVRNTSTTAALSGAGTPSRRPSFAT